MSVTESLVRKPWRRQVLPQAPLHTCWLDDGGQCENATNRNVNGEWYCDKHWPVAEEQRRRERLHAHVLNGVFILRVSPSECVVGTDIAGWHCTRDGNLCIERNGGRKTIVDRTSGYFADLCAELGVQP